MLSVCHSRQKYKNSSVFKYREKRRMMTTRRGRADTENTFPTNSHSANWGSLRVTRKGSFINGQQNGVTILLKREPESVAGCTHRQDWCSLESQDFGHPCVPATDSLNGSFRDLYCRIPSSYQDCILLLHSGTMDGENRPLVTDESVESEKQPVEVEDDIRKIAHRFRGIYRNLPQISEEDRKITTWLGNTEGFDWLCPKISPDTAREWARDKF